MATRELEFERHELEVLAQCCRLMDRLDDLAAAVAEQGVTVTTSRGDVRAHPAVTEERQVSQALGRLLGQLEIPDEDDERLRSPTSVRAAKAANARWGAHRARWGEAG